MIVTNYAPVLPARLLLEPSRKPEYTGQTWGDVVKYSLELRESLDLCNADKEALVKWYDGVRNARTLE